MTAAYVKYVPHMDRPPGPMLDNYAQRIASDEAFVAMGGALSDDEYNALYLQHFGIELK